MLMLLFTGFLILVIIGLVVENSAFLKIINNQKQELWDMNGKYQASLHENTVLKTRIDEMRATEKLAGK